MIHDAQQRVTPRQREIIKLLRSKKSTTKTTTREKKKT